MMDHLMAEMNENNKDSQKKSHQKKYLKKKRKNNSTFHWDSVFEVMTINGIKVECSKVAFVYVTYVICY